MDDKIKLYEKILEKYDHPNDGTFLSTEDIKFEFEAEAIFIKKYMASYILFIEDNNNLYLFIFNFKKKNSIPIRYVKARAKSGLLGFYHPDSIESLNKNELNKFDFIIKDLFNIISQIKSERIFLLLQGHEIK